MKIRCVLGALLIASAVSAAAQSRNDVRIYIPLVVAVDPMQAEFFQKNFAMEIATAGYTVAESVTEADFSMRLRVTSNATVYSDGTSSPIPPGENLYSLQITLIRNSDNSSVVSLSFGFSVLEEMYNHNLSLVYQTLANVPLSKSDDKTLVKFMVGKEGERYDWWRNKWLYLRVSLDYPVTYYQKKTGGSPQEGFDAVAMPGVTVGLEAHFLYWMSFEANIEVRSCDRDGLALIPGIGAQLKFPLKPASEFMIEPYIAGVLSTAREKPKLYSLTFDQYSIGGGVQFGVRTGNTGILFFDANYMYHLPSKKPSASLYQKRFVVGLGVGYKIGFFSRGVKREENSTWLFNNK